MQACRAKPMAATVRVGQLQYNWVLLLLLVANASHAYSCEETVMDFFCETSDEPSDDFWVVGQGMHSSATLNGLDAGGLQLFQGGMLATKNDFFPSAQSPVSVRIRVQSSASMSLEFDVCTRADGQTWSTPRDVLELGSGGVFSGFHTYSQLYYVKNGVCMHFSKVSQASSQWFMKIVVVSPDQAPICESSSLVPLDIMEGDSWDITLDDNGSEVVGSVVTSGGTQHTATSVSCSPSLPTSHSKVVVFDYFKEGRDSSDQANLVIGFASVRQGCSILNPIQTNSWKMNSMPCTSALQVNSGARKVQASASKSILEQNLLWNMPVRFQTNRTPEYTNSQAFLLFVHISRVALDGNGDVAVAVRMNATLCGQTVSSLVSNPRSNGNAGLVLSSPLAMHGLTSCSSDAGEDELDFSLFTTTDGVSVSRSGTLYLPKPGTRDQFANAEIIVTVARVLQEDVAFIAGELSSKPVPVSSGGNNIDFLSAIGATSALPITTTANKPNALLLFDAPDLISVDMDFVCLRFSVTIDSFAVSNKSACLPVSSNADTFANNFFPFAMHADAPGLEAGSHEVGIMFETTCYFQTCEASTGQINANGPWRLSALAISDGAYSTQRSNIGADPACTCTFLSEGSQSPWTPLDSSPILEVHVTERGQEVIILADVDRIETCQEQSVGLRIVRVADLHVVSELSFYLAAVPPKSFAWHGSVQLEPGTHSFRLEYTSTYPLLFCSQWDAVEHKLSALILPDAALNSATPSAMPRFTANSETTDVTITGSGFRERAAVRMGSTACVETNWQSESSLVCKAGVGVGRQLRAAVTVDLVGMRTAEALFSYAAPAVQRTGNSPVFSLGAFVEATGATFGFHDYSAAAYVGKTACIQTRWISDTALRYSPAPGTSSAAVDVVVAGSGVDPSATVSLHTFDAPHVTAVQPRSASTSGSSQLTLLGGNFGAADYSLALSVDQTRCVSALWQSDTSVVCALPPGIGSGTRVAAAEFEGGDGGSSLSKMHNCTSDFCRGGLTMAFSYAGPELDSLEWLWVIVPHPENRFSTMLGRANGPSAGAAKITAFGTHFGTFAHSESSIRVGGTSCSQTEWASATKLTCQVAPGVAFDRDVVMTVARQIVSAEKLFSYDTPSHLGGEVTFAPAVSNATTTVTVLGNDLGSHDWSPRMSIGLTACLKTEWVSDSSIAVVLADGVGADLDVGMVYNAADSLSLYQFSYLSPSELSARPNSTNFPTEGGTVVSVLGLHFGSADYSNRLAVHGTNCASSNWLSDTAMACKSPAGAGSSRVLTASVSTQTADGQPVSFDRPSVTSVNHSNAPISQDGTVVAVLGKGFGSVDYSPKGRIGDTACLSTQWVAASSILCKVPWGFNIQLSATVTVERTSGTLSDAFSYDGVVPPVPHISHAVPATLSTVGSEITIVGRFAGPLGLKLPEGVQKCSDRGSDLPGSEDCPFLGAEDMQWRAYVGHRDCDGQLVGTVCGTTTWISESSLLCAAPTGIGQNLGVFVETEPPEYALFAQAASTGFAEATVSYDLAQVLTTTSNLPTAGGNMTVIGSGFGTVDTTGRLRVGATACDATTWASDSSMSCQVASGGWPVGSLVMTTAGPSCRGQGVGNSHTVSSPFNYDRATIVGWTTGAAINLEVNGANFGHVDLSPTVKVQGTAAPMTSWVSDSSVVAVMPHGVGGSLDLVIEYEQSTLSCEKRNDSLAQNDTSGVGESDQVCSWIPFALHRGTLEGGFSFSAPTPAQIITDQPAVWSGNFSVTVTGAHFGAEDYSLQGRVGYTACESATWLSSSSLACKVAPGSHADLDAMIPFSVTVQGQVGQEQIFEYINKGAARLSLSCGSCVDPGDNGDTLEGEGLPVSRQPKIQIEDDWGRPITAENDTQVSASLVKGTEIVSTLGGTTTVVAVGGIVSFTDLRVDGATAGSSVRLRFSASKVEEAVSAPITVAYVRCEPAYVVSGPQVASELGGDMLTLQLEDFFPYSQDQLNVTFSQGETIIPVPVGSVSTNPEGVTTIIATIPPWPTGLDPLVDVGLLVTPLQGTLPPPPCFQMVLIDLAKPRVQEIAPGFCTTQGEGAQQIALTDPGEQFSFDQFNNMELVFKRDGAELSRMPLELTDYLGDGTRVLSFECQPFEELETLELSIEIESGPEEGTLVCCEYPYFAPVDGFSLRYIPPAADVSPTNVIPAVSHSTADLTVYFPEAKLEVNATLFGGCESVVEDERVPLAYVGPLDGSAHSFQVTLRAAEEGRFPRTVPIRVECRGSALGLVSTGASFVYYRQPVVSSVVPRRVEVYGGIIEISIDGFLFPLRADQLIIDLHMPSGQVVRINQFSIPVQGLQRTTFALTVPESADLLSDEAYISFEPQATPEDVSPQLFVARANFSYFQPPAEIVEMEPNVLEAGGNREVTLLIGKFQAISSVEDIRITFEDDPTPLEVTRLIFSDESSTSLQFLAREHEPGPVTVLVAPTGDPNNTGSAVLTFQGTGVSASCARVKRSLTSEPIDLAPSDPCVVSSVGDSMLTIRLQGFGTDESDLRIVVGGILQDAWRVVSANEETALVELEVPPMPSSTERGADGCLPPIVTQNLAALLDSDPTTVAITTFSYNTKPCLSSSRFAPSAIELELRFNQRTDQGGVQGSDYFDCARVLALESRQNPWGNGGQCFWLNSKQLNAQLGPGEDDELVNVADFFTLLDVDLKIRPALGFNLTASGTYMVTEPTRVVLPQARISGPNQASSCVLDQLVLQGLVTSPRSVTFSWSADDENLNTFLSSRLDAELIIPSTQLVSGVDYVISLEVVDFLGATSEQASHNLRKVPGNIPVVRIDGARPFLASESNFFLTVVRFSQCIPQKEDMTFDWKVLNYVPAGRRTGSEDYLFESEKPGLDIPPGILLPSTKYTVLLSAGNAGRVPGLGSFDFETGVSDLISSIDGGDRIQPRSMMLELDASLSRDPDQCLFDATLNDVFDISDDCFKDVTGGTACSMQCSDTSLVFEWSCRIKGLLCRKQDFSLLQLPSEPIIAVDLSAIADMPSEVSFEVKVTKGSRASASPVRISVLDLDQIPTLDIVLGFTRKTDSAGVRYVNRVDTIRGLAVTDYCEMDGVDCGEDGSEPQYVYSAVESIDLEEVAGNVLSADDTVAVPTGLNSPSIVIGPNVLVTGKQYALKLDLFIQDNLLASARVFLQVNQPPSAGQCKVQPTTGMEINTAFAASCEKWFDQDLPLQYIFGYQTRGSAEVMVTPPQLGATYDLRLPAGLVDITISVVDALGSPTATRLLARVNETAPDESALENLDEGTGDAGKLGDTSALMQQSSSAASQLTVTRRRHRELLASSAAYRMRVRRMLLRKSSGASGNIDKKSGGPILGSVESLSSNEEELVPQGGDPKDASELLESNTGLVYTSVCSVSSQELAGDTSEKAMKSLAQLVGSINRLPITERDRTLLSAIDSLTHIVRSIGQGMTPGEPARSLGKGEFIGAVQKRNVPSGLSFNIQNAVPNFNYSFTLPQWTSSSEIVLPAVYVSLPWETNLTETTFPITPVFGLEVVIDRTNRRRRRGRRRLGGVSAQPQKRRSDPQRPFRRSGAPSPFGQPEESLDVELENLDFEVVMPIQLEDGDSLTNRWNATELEQVRQQVQFLYEETVRCLQWNQFSWSDQFCELPEVSEDGKSVTCRCSRAGLFIAAYLVPDTILVVPVATATFQLNHWVLGYPIWFTLAVGFIALIVTLLAEAKWYFELQAAPYLHSGIHESRLARRHVLSGWFGELFPEDSQFYRTPTQTLEDRKRRFQDQSFRGYSFVINRDGDQTLFLSCEIHEFEDMMSARTVTLLETLKAEVAQVLSVDRNRVRIGEVDVLDEETVQIHVFYSSSLARSARGLGEALKRYHDEGKIQKRAETGCFRKGKKLQMLNRVKEIKKGYDPVDLFMGTDLIESTHDAHTGTIAAFGVGKEPSYAVTPSKPASGEQSHLSDSRELPHDGVQAPAPYFRREPAQLASAALDSDNSLWMHDGGHAEDVTWTRAQGDSASVNRGREEVDAHLAGVDDGTIKRSQQVPISLQGSVKPVPPFLAYSADDLPFSLTGVAPPRNQERKIQDVYGAAMASYMDGVE